MTWLLRVGSHLARVVDTPFEGKVPMQVRKEMAVAKDWDGNWGFMRVRTLISRSPSPRSSLALTFSRSLKKRLFV